MRWTSVRDISEVIQRGRPCLPGEGGNASWPSSVIADFSVTNGRRVVTHVAKASLRRWGSAENPSNSTSIPAARKALKPRRETAGFGSGIAETTRATPAAMSARARSGTPRVAAGLKVDEERFSARGSARGFERQDFGVSHSIVSVETLANHALIANEHGADHWVWARQRFATPRQG